MTEEIRFFAVLAVLSGLLILLLIGVSREYFRRGYRAGYQSGYRVGCTHYREILRTLNRHQPNNNPTTQHHTHDNRNRN